MHKFIASRSFLSCHFDVRRVFLMEKTTECQLDNKLHCHLIGEKVFARNFLTLPQRYDREARELTVKIINISGNFLTDKVLEGPLNSGS